jgi:hypothetical protein
VSAFNPVDGSLVNATFVPIASTGGTKVGCIEVNGEVWVSEQTGDRIVRYATNGTVLGVIGPTFAGGGLDNCRGMSLINGLVHIANDGAGNGAVANSLTVFDVAGNFVAAWPLPSTTSPYSVIDHQGGLVVASADANDDLHRYTYAGTSVGTFHNTASVNFAHQVARALDGNVWCATFTTSTVVKLDATTGNVLMSFPASNARGVFELWNGNVLWTSSTGVRVYDMVTQTSTLVQAGAYGHANLFGTATAASATPYGTGCDGLALAATGLPLIGNGSFALALSNVPAVSPSACSRSARRPSTPASTLPRSACRAAPATSASTSACTPAASWRAVSAPSRCRCRTTPRSPASPSRRKARRSPPRRRSASRPATASRC